MVKALKRELPSVLAIYHIMHKRADTIGCVWLAYCINSLYSYFDGNGRSRTCNVATTFHRSRTEWAITPLCRYSLHSHIVRTDVLNFTLRHFSSIPSRQKKGGVKMKKFFSLCPIYYIIFILYCQVQPKQAKLFL